MTTREAFTQLCQDRDRCERIGMNDGSRRAYLSYLNKNRYVSLDKMEEWLGKAGYHVKQEKVWANNALDSFFETEEIIEMIKNLHPWKNMVNVKKEDGPVPGHHTYTIVIKTKSPIA